MATVIVSGSGGLIGSEAVRYFVDAGYDVVGLDNDMRAAFFGSDASTLHVSRGLSLDYPEAFRWLEADIRDDGAVRRAFKDVAGDLELVVHTAAQPSHDWAATDPHADFSINAGGTLNLLEATRHFRPDATFVFCSTNKVYGDRPNSLPLIEAATRVDLPDSHAYWDGVTTDMSIDRTKHSLFGASKVAADVLVQEYGRYFDMPTVSFRGGCLTGPSHRGAQLHGFLAYLMQCVVSGTPYTVFGYGGKQVRDNIHARDVVRAFAEFHASPRCGAVYNLGGGRENSISVLEAIAACELIAARELQWSVADEARSGDHHWWISGVHEFRRDYPSWRIEYDLERTLVEIHDAQIERRATAQP